MDLSKAFQKPSFHHIFGMDPFGEDLGIKILEGAVLSAKTALTVTVSVIFISLFLSFINFYSPQILQNFFKRIIDGFLAFPGLLLAILLASLLPSSNLSITFALILTGWAGPTRLFSNLTLNISNEPFIEAIRASGADNKRIYLKHIIPQMSNQIMIQIIYTISHTILSEAGLTFLGLGGAPGSPSWGRLIAEGRQYLVEAPHLSIAPGLFLILTLFGLFYLGSKFQNHSQNMVR